LDNKLKALARMAKVPARMAKTLAPLTANSLATTLTNKVNKHNVFLHITHTTTKCLRSLNTKLLNTTLTNKEQMAIAPELTVRAPELTVKAPEITVNNK
jgi:hypothetical protein